MAKKIRTKKIRARTVKAKRTSKITAVLLQPVVFAKANMKKLLAYFK